MSHSRAAEVSQAAAKFGLAEACNMLATMYEHGLGRQIDMASAVYWYKISARKSNSDALNNLGRIYESGVKGFERSLNLAAQFYYRAAEQNHLDAQTNLGYLLQLGLGCEVDFKKAVDWYKLAAEQDYARAQNCLGSMYYRGLGVKQDFGQAVLWYRKAADQGNPHGQNNLGICYEEGHGVVRDYAMAKQLYNAAAEFHHPNATNNLGYLTLLEVGAGFLRTHFRRETMKQPSSYFIWLWRWGGNLNETRPSHLPQR